MEVHGGGLMVTALHTLTGPRSDWLTDQHILYPFGGKYAELFRFHRLKLDKSTFNYSRSESCWC